VTAAALLRARRLAASLEAADEGRMGEPDRSTASPDLARQAALLAVGSEVALPLSQLARAHAETAAVGCARDVQPSIASTPGPASLESVAHAYSRDTGVARPWWPDGGRCLPCEAHRHRRARRVQGCAVRWA